MTVGNANNGAGWDHICTKNERHGLWDPSTLKDGRPCPILDRGNACGGKLKVVGAGSRTASTTSAAA